MRDRPAITCLVAKPGPRGNVDDIEILPLEEAAAKMTAGWLVVGPDPEDEIAFNLWLREVNAQYSTGYDPGDEHD